MKAFVTLSLLCLIGASLASPILRDDGQHRWALVPDSEGAMHIVDLNPLNIEFEPRFVAEEDIILSLRTRSNPTSPQVIQMTVASLAASNWNPNNPTRFTIHGWTSSGADPLNSGTAAAYFVTEDVNHVTVDWSVGAQTINYITARNRVDDVGEFLGRFIDFCHLNGYINFATLHVIGHSLGGHAAGMTGKNTSRGRPSVIYSLDPAGPLFTVGNPDRRVAVGDADYVEVIHTNGNILGFGDPIGDADFYPNGGERQPGCGTDTAGGCAHSRIQPLFIESINSARFNAFGCVSYASITDDGCQQNTLRSTMGRDARIDGMFWFATASESPFALG